MRNRLLAALTLVSVAVTPTVTIAEPATSVKLVEDHKVVEAIKATIDTFEIPSKDELAKAQIQKNIEKLEQEKAEAARKAAEEKKRIARRAVRVIKVDARSNFSAVYAAAGARFGVSPAILAAVHYVETGGRGNTTVGSYAGAQGPMQFMPSTFRAYAVDGDGDGVANIYDVDDAIYTAARYLAANGAASGGIVRALFRYNHSLAYVNKVLGIARGFGYNA